MTRTSTGVALALALVLAAGAIAQPTSSSPVAPPPNGPRRADPTAFALVGGTIHVKPGVVIQRGSVVIRGNRIAEVVDLAGAPDWKAPPGFKVHDATGLHLYPGFIDAYVEVDAPKPDRNAPGAHWNARVTPERSAMDGAGLSNEAAESLRKMGFAAAAISPRGGVFRGTSSVVSLAQAAAEASADRPPVHRAVAYHALGFDTRNPVESAPGSSPDVSRWSDYPDSQMGAIALIRQTLIDADWERASGHGATRALGALTPDPAPGGWTAPLAFDTGNELEILRAAKIAAEAQRPLIIIGSGSEYRRIDAIASAEGIVGMVVPLAFARKPDVSSLGAIENVELRDLMAWEQSPTNLRRLDAAGIRVAITSSKLGRGQRFEDNLKAAIKHGLAPDRALAMLTTVPAEILGLSESLGTIEASRQANIIVADGDLFPPAPAPRKAGEPKPPAPKSAKLLDLWVDGQRHVLSDPKPTAWEGSWAIAEEGKDPITITVDDKGALTIKSGDKTVKASGVKLTADQVDLTIDATKLGGDGAWTVRLVRQGEVLTGTVLRLDGRIATWKGARAAPEGKPEAQAQPETPPDAKGDPGKEGEKKPEEPEVDWTKDIPERYGYPFGPYALMPDQKPGGILILQNATIWTSGPDGVLHNAWMIVREGRIAGVGVGPVSQAGTYDGVTVMDLNGLHVTPGLIDCHSHTGISGGVNEAGQAITAEVRIQDVTNPDSINWYRQLAGGITTVNNLHGSANAIGGQNCVNKVRWGAVHPDDMHMSGAIAGIKFALGENPRQANWGDRATVRYPQTRMGVETIIRDRFTEAREYLDAWASAAAKDSAVLNGLPESFRKAVTTRTATTPGGAPPRRDLELEAIAEILGGTRLVHCHSYRQDEILMLCRIAEEFGFTIGTFQHVLEGYKVADEIAKHALGASSFSDWWAYKVEVQDAIPHNGAIMRDQGVVVSFNSDSDELARRMNTEATKAVRYGDVPPAEALKFVTINPAIQLGIADRVGSLEPGKDADFAIWSGDPLATTSKCVATYVDGVRLFSTEDDLAHRESIAKERSRLIQKIMAMDRGGGGPGSGGPSSGPGRGGPGRVDGPPPTGETHELAALRERALDMLRRGLDPSAPTCGDCGMSLLHDH